MGFVVDRVDAQRNPDHLNLFLSSLCSLFLNLNLPDCSFKRTVLSPRAHVIPFWESSEENEPFLTGIRRHHFRKALVYHSGKTRALEE